MINKKTLNPIVLHAVLIAGVLLTIVPFIWMILTAFKSISESTQLDPFIIFPQVWRTEAFKSVIAKMDFFRLYWNTFVLIAGRIICAVTTASLAGYALARLEFKGKNSAFALECFEYRSIFFAASTRNRVMYSFGELPVWFLTILYR